MILFFISGPKYILKLQQEVTAMRVMISMDTHSHVDGASKVHTIKRYLSEHKDESIINTSSMRCREVDCLKAYYYVAIINFLKESCYSGEENGTVSCEQKSATSTVPSEGASTRVSNTETKPSGECINLDGSNSEKNQNETQTEIKDKPVDHDPIVVSSNPEIIVTCPPDSSETETSESACDKTEKAQDQNNSETKEMCDSGKEDSPQSKESSVDSVACVDVETSDLPKTSQDNNTASVKDKENVSAALDSKDNIIVSKQSLCQTVPVLNLNHYSITVARLSQLSQGLLWDIQAKRFALTETLGYIHKAISQLLLSKNSQSKESPGDNENGTKELKEDGKESTEQENGDSCNGKENGDEKCIEKDKIKDTKSKHHEASSVGKKEPSTVSMTTEDLFKKDGHICPGAMMSYPEVHICDHHLQESHMDSHICPVVLSQHFDQMLNIHVPHVGQVPVNSCHSDADPDLKCSFFDVCSSCELLHKSRKILFEDETRFHTRPEVGFKDMTNIINPAKYINVPDEWYSMPVDQKYFKRYITMAILKDEQEYVMGELKRGPDGTQVSTDDCLMILL